MKKILFCLTLAIAGVVATGCSCQSENKRQDEVSTGKPLSAEVKVLALTPETCITADREAMYLRTGKEATLHWMQTGITLTAFLTDEAIQDATVMEVTNGFQTQKPAGKGTDTKVTLITTNTMTTDSLVVNGSFYLDNYPLNDKQICLTFAQAIEKVLRANCTKPQTRIVTLRSPLGPVHVDDAYYILGNGQDGTPAVFVNARTGDVTTYNPAFGKQE